MPIFPSRAKPMSGHASRTGWPRLDDPPPAGPRPQSTPRGITAWPAPAAGLPHGALTRQGCTPVRADPPSKSAPGRVPDLPAPERIGPFAAAARFHAGGSSRGPGRLRVPSRDCRFSPEEVPSLLPQVWFDDHLAHLIDHIPQINSWTVRQLRRAASLQLMEMTAGGTWGECAETLGMPRGSVASTLQVLHVAMPTDLWEEFAASVERIAVELDDNPNRVNYARRRRAMATWRMPASEVHVRSRIMTLCDPSGRRPSGVSRWVSHPMEGA